jgi:hypothetical protein
MENNLLTTPNTNLRLSRIWNCFLMIGVLFIFAGQSALAQRVPVPCSGSAPFVLIGEDAATATSNDAKIRISGVIANDDRVGYSIGNTYTGTAFAGTAKLSTFTGGYLSQTLPTPTNTAGTEYTIRVYKADTTCYYDEVFTLDYVNFNAAPVYPDIQVTAAKTPAGFVALGTTVSILVTVQNKGTGPASGVEYTVGIPAGFTGVTGATANGTYDGLTKKWTIGAVSVYDANDASTTKTLTLTGTVSTRGVKYLTADLTAEVENDTDSRPTTILNSSNSPGEDDFGSVCISTPFDYCTNDEYTITLPTYTGIIWSKGVTIITAGNAASEGVRLNVDGSLTVFVVGEYSYSMTTGPNACPSGGCCPISVEAGKPPVLVDPTAQQICFNTAFSAVASTNTQTSPNGTYIYQWYNDNGIANPTKTAISGQNTLAFSAFPTAVGVYTYKLKAYEEGHPNCADSVTVTLEIKALPVPVIATISPVCEQSPINFSATPVGAKTYAWSGPNGFIGNTATPTITSALLTSAGTYVVTVTNGVDCEATASVAVLVNPKPIAPTVVAKTFCEEDPEIALTATLLGADFLQWYGNSSTGGVGSTTPDIVNPTSAGVTNYYVSQKINVTGCESDRSELVVTVYAKPVAPQTVPVSACQNATPLTLNISESSTGFTVLWYGLNSTGGTSSTTKDIAPTNTVGTTTYYVSWKENAHSCESNRSLIPVEIRATPVPTLASIAPVCKESPINFTAGPAGATEYAWSGPNGFTGSNINNPTIASAALASAGTYVVTVTNGVQCSASTSVVVVVNDLPAIPQVTAKIFCADDAQEGLVATALSGNHILWYGNSSSGGVGTTEIPIYNPTSAGVTSYYASQVDVNACESHRNELVVKVNEKPENPVAGDKVYCQFATATALLVSGKPLHTFLWYGQSSTGGTTTNVPVPSTAATGTTTYYVSQVNPSTGCESDRDDAIVIVNRTPAAPIVGGIAYCQTEQGKTSIAVPLTATSEGGNTTIWYTGGGTTTTAPTPETQIAGLTYFYVSQSIPGTNCESAMSGIPVTIKPLPVARVIAVNSLCIGTESQNNAKFILNRYRNNDAVVHYNTGTEITGITIPVLAKPYAGGLFASNLPNPTIDSQSYKVRIRNSDTQCSIDVDAVLTKTNCGCPGGYCEPATITKIK